jgi:dsDNA-binding SOS-regulon protein
VAAVSRFISCLGGKALPLYKLMKKSDKFVWTDKADTVLKDLKRVLSTAPVLAAPEDQEPILLYMAATNRGVSIVIVVERKEEAQEYGVQ